MFIDNVFATLKAGDGGNGAATFRRDALTAKGGPDGGNGGNGGNIYVQGSSNMYDLSQFRYKKKITAENGISGKRRNLFGKNAPHINLIMPLGTQITDTLSGEIIEIIDSFTSVLLVAGGKGGRGNVAFKSPINRTPLYAESGRPGETKKLQLELKLIAEVGLIGLPNAGKSSLLSVLTNAKPKIDTYPFTTLTPNIGIFQKWPIADIPGLIEGASTGKGLGINFLKHIEKTHILIHCLDVSNPEIIENYHTVISEMEQYSAKLKDKEEIIYLSKTDLTDTKSLQHWIKYFKSQKKLVIAGSIYDPKSITDTKKLLLKKLSHN